MTCEEVRSRLSWYIDDELPPREAEAVREHLSDGCEGCRARLADLRSNDGEIREALKGVRPSEDFAQRVVSQVRPKPPRFIRPVLWAAAALLVGLTGVIVRVNTLKPEPLGVLIHGSESLHADSLGALRVFVTNEVTKAPIAQAVVRILLANQEVGKFLTSAAGTIDGFFRVPDLGDGSYPLAVEVHTPLGDQSLARTVTVRREYRLLLSTDKPAYQPGQTIQMRALALNAFTLKPRPGDGEFEVQDSKGNRIFSKKVQLSEFGIASAELPLADEINLGTYRLAITASGLRQERTVEVAKYVLPKFKVELELDKPSYRPGQAVRGKVKAAYFFGKAVQGRVRATLGREIVSGDLREDGSWEFEAPAPSGDGTLPVEVTVTDSADHREQKSLPAVVSSEPLKVLLYPEGGSVVRGVENTFYLLVSYPDGRPAKADLELRVNDRSVEASTDELGVAKIQVRPPHQVRLERARDKAGNETRKMDDRTAVGPHDFLLRLDKAAYRAGETMKVSLVGALNEPVYLDLVKGGQLILAKAVAGGETAIDLPPDLFGTLQVVAYKKSSAEPVVRIAYVNLPEGLRIRPRLSRESFRPGEEMPVDLEVVDPNGKPVQAALGISVVDEALFGLVESKMASEKAWLSLAPELIETRGFLKAEAGEIYQRQAPNARGFVSANSRAGRPGILLSGDYTRKLAELEASIERFNGTMFFAGRILALLGGAAFLFWILGMPIVERFRWGRGDRAATLVLILLWPGIVLLWLAGWAAGWLGVIAAVLSAAAIHAAIWWHDRHRPLVSTLATFLIFIPLIAFLGLLSSRKGSGPGIADWGQEDWVLFSSRPLPSPAAAPPAPSEERARDGLEMERFRSKFPEARPAPAARVPASVAPAPPKPEPGSYVALPTIGGPANQIPAPEKEDGRSESAPRIREYFPETLFWRPELITDERGRARLTLPPADSITSWRMLASAISRTGALGFEQASIKVFQDFFIDIDFPVALTKGDRVQVPVAVYNYLKERQTVRIRAEKESWFELKDEESKSITLGPGEVSVVYFGLKVKDPGRRTFTVFAEGKVKDAVRRSVDVMEKGREIAVSQSDRVQGRRTFRIELPDRAIEGSTVLFARLSPSVGDLMTGLEGMIHMPYG